MSADTSIRQPGRLASGVAGLDTVLSGGFLQAGIYIIRGKPGGGKTILGNQIAYSHIAGGGKALYVTVLAESHTRMLQHLSGMSFFDAAVVSTGVSYISAFRELDEDGLKGLLTLIRREIGRTKATVLILDGLVTVGEEAASQMEFKKFIHELQAVAVLTNCTMFLLTSAITQPVTPEQTMVDGIVELQDEIVSALAMRTIEVSKFRGSDAIRGRHAFHITSDGLKVLPRFEALYRTPTGPAGYTAERTTTGIPTLDAAIGGGVPRASSTIVLGTSGTGKTSVGLSFVAQCDEPALYFGFYETPSRLIGKGESLGLDLRRKVESKQVHLIWNPTTEVLLDQLGHQLVDCVRKHGIKRVVIDAFGGLETATQQPGRMPRFYGALSNELRALGVTTFLIVESRDLVGSSIPLPGSNISSIAENMFVLKMSEIKARLRHTLSVFKIRDSDYDHRVRELLFSSKGLALGGGFPGVEDVLTASGHVARDAAQDPGHDPGRDERG